MCASVSSWREKPASCASRREGVSPRVNPSTPAEDRPAPPAGASSFHRRALDTLDVLKSPEQPLADPDRLQAEPSILSGNVTSGTTPAIGQFFRRQMHP